MSKRPLTEIETELETAERLKTETKERIKRLRTERDAHEDFVAKQRAASRALLEQQLPPYLFEVLVAHPRDPELYGSLLSFSIEKKRHSRYLKDGLYASELLITARFEKKTVDYVQDADTGGWSYPPVPLPLALDGNQRPTMTQQQVWARALKLNKDDTGKAFIALCEDAYCLIDDFEDKEVAAPLREVEVYRRLHCKLPHLTADDVREFNRLEAYSWEVDLEAMDGEDLARRLNESKDLFDSRVWEMK
jgi:hypothetical protein